MAIDAYVGKPGHGKSYGVVEHVVIPSLKQGRVVVTNIPLQIDLLMKDFGGVVFQLADGWDKDPEFSDKIPHGCVLVLDEIWRRWPSGLAVNKANESDKVLFMEHRHRVDDLGNSMRIILVTQDLAQVSSWVRLLIEQTFRVVKRVNVGMTSRYRVDIYDGPVTGDRPPKNKFLRSIGGKYRAQIYKYYSSATQSQTGTVGDESKADGRGNALKSTSLLLCGIFILVMLTVSVKSCSSYFAPVLDHPKPALKVPPPAPVSQPAVQAPIARQAAQVVDVVVPTGPVSSLYWRVAGYIEKGTGLTAEAWPSRSGYGGSAEQQIEPGLKMPGQVILMSVNNKVRYLPITDCQWYPDKIHLNCLVDGEMVTPWTGQGAVTAGLPSSRGEVRAGTAAGSRSGSDVVTTVASPVQSVARVTVVEESRLPRTLLTQTASD